MTTNQANSDIASPYDFGQQNLIKGCRIAFVGKLGGMNRKDLRSLARERDAMVVEKPDASVDWIVIGADHLEVNAHENEWLTAEVESAAGAGKLRIIDETEFWQILGMVDDVDEVGQLYTPAMLANLLEVPLASIRRWHRRGLITPTRMIHKLPYFDFQEVASARRIARLIASGASPTSIESKLSRLAELNIDAQRPLAQLSIIVDGRSVLLRHDEGLVDPNGQKHFDFEAIEIDDENDETSVFVFDGVDPKSLAEFQTPKQFLDLATELEDGLQLDSAIEVYRAMGLAFGPSADISFRTAEILYQQGDLQGARERYFMAIELEPSFVEARASLGCVLVELQSPELAVSAFEGALEHHPDYSDVHFYLAGVLDELNREPEAMLHWQTFIDLAPKSPWAEEAIARLQECSAN